MYSRFLQSAELDLVELVVHFKEMNQEHDFYSWLGVEVNINKPKINNG
jgi:hypothetical protein